MASSWSQGARTRDAWPDVAPRQGPVRFRLTHAIRDHIRRIRSTPTWRMTMAAKKSAPKGKKGGKKTKTTKKASKTAKKPAKRKAAKKPAKRAAARKPVKKAAPRSTAKPAAAPKAAPKAAPPAGVPSMLGGAPTSSHGLGDGEEQAPR